MNRQRARKKTNIEGDRISSLPDDIIAKIISKIDLKQAVETSVLSSRWRFIWTKIPCINISSKNFSTLNKLHSFLALATSYNDLVEMSLDLHGKCSDVVVQRILEYACSHNLQQLTFTFLSEDPIVFPLSLFSSQSLKHLTLFGVGGHYAVKSTFVKTTSMWELPTLTTLHIERIILYDDNESGRVGFLSNCPNLKNLTLKRCCIIGSNNFTICHPQLSNLILEDMSSQNVFNVVARQLKNLTVEGWEGELRICAPNLTSMLYKAYKFWLSLDTDELFSLEKASLCTHLYKGDDAYRVVDLLKKFSHVKFLTLNSEITKFLSSSDEASACERSPFVNLRSLKIYPEQYYRKEIRAARDAESAQKLMAELKVLLDVENARIEKMEEDKRPLDMGNRVAQVRNCWEDLDEEIKRGKKKTNEIRSRVKRIKALLVKLPKSNKAELLQTLISTLCTEASTVVSNIRKRMKFLRSDHPNES